MLGYLFWLLVGTLGGAIALVLVLDWLQHLGDPDPGYGLEVAIGAVAAAICVFAMYRVVTHMRHHGLG